MIPNDIEQVIAKYPNHAKTVFLKLRALIFDCAQSLSITDLEETLKWGEPSYLCKTGSTIRIDWKPASPENINIYFNCKSKLIETINELYDGQLLTQGTRSIVLPLHKTLDSSTLSHCFEMALNYHKIKNKPLLGN